jgi:hypothetical protein
MEEIFILKDPREDASDQDSKFIKDLPQTNKDVTINLRGGSDKNP